MKIAAFVSHPIQYFGPLWKELSRRPGLQLKVFYYSQENLKPSQNPEFGVSLSWDIDLLEGYEYEFLPRQWPTTDPLNPRWNALNKSIAPRLREGWDVAYVPGYIHLNNWNVAYTCRRLGIPLLCSSDVSMITAREKGRLSLLIKRIIVRSFLRQVAGCLAVGDHSRDYFCYYGVAPEAIDILPYIVDTQRFQQTVAAASSHDIDAIRCKYKIPPDKQVVLFSGKFIPRKRPVDLALALRKLGRDDVVGVFIGEGELRAEIERVGGKHVIVTGFVNQKEMPLLLSLGTMLVLPSSFEAYGLVVTEAMAVGVPALVSDRCGCYGPNGILRDGESGLLYPCGDIEQLAEKIEYLLNNSQLRSAMGRKGQQITETMSPGPVADRFLHAAEKAIASKTR